MLIELLVVGVAVYYELTGSGKDRAQLSEVTSDGCEASHSLSSADTSLPYGIGPHAPEQTVDRELRLALAAFGLTTIGAFGYPVLTLLGLPILLYQLIPVIRLAYQDLVEEQKVGGNVVRALIRLILLGLGAFQAAALWGGLYWGTEKLLLKVQNMSRQRLSFAFGERPRFVWLHQPDARDTEVEVALEDVRVGDIVIVHAGEAIPVDGIITDGAASIDQRMLTGEGQPIEKGVGESVLAATIVLSGTVWVRVEKEGSDTLVAHIEEILHNTASYTSSLELKGKAFAEQSVLPILGLSLATLPLLGLEAAVCVFACNFGEGMRALASLSLLNFLRIAAEQRIIVKDGRALESLQDVDTVVFDKTGTLTQDQPHVTAIHPCASYTPTELLRYAASAEVKQTHPLARAIVHEAEQQQLELSAIDGASYEIGYGLKVRVDNHSIQVGSARFMEREGLVVPTDLAVLAETCRAQGNSAVYIAVDEAVSGAIELHPTIRPEVKDIVQSLQQRGLEVYIVSGDHEQPTQQLARSLGIQHYLAGALPEDKAKLADDLQSNGRSVCFVGDGINDALALKKAHVSVSLSGASTIASDSAQIVFMEASLTQMLPLFELAKDLAANMYNNLLTLIVPSGIILGGVYFLNFRFFAAAAVSFLGAIAGIVNAMLPALTYQPPEESNDLSPQDTAQDESEEKSTGKE